jgi:hypothetical protein
VLRATILLLLLVPHRPELPTATRPTPAPTTVYIHSKYCQELYYLHIDCFDECNGTQYFRQQPPDQAPLYA